MAGCAQATLVSLSFNEAAADAAEFSECRGCSDAACGGFNEAAADAAEFFGDVGDFDEEEEASMRPRQMPRNFSALIAEADARDEASMRPRQMPRNFRRRSRRWNRRRRGFNEAAADAAEFSASPSSR